MKRRVLIVGEQRDFLERLRQQLENEPSLLAVTAGSTDAGVELALELQPHLILVETTLAGPGGHEACRRLRRDWETSEIPLLLLLDRTGNEADSLLLKLRADDYIEKSPVSEQLLSKVRKMIRHRPTHADSKPFDDGHLFIDFDAYIVRANGRELKLARKEFSLLKFLVQNAGRVFSRDKLLEVVWGDFPKGRTVDVHVRRLRMKLGPESEHYLETIVGVGYSFRPKKRPAISSLPTDAQSHASHS
jgi:DNA-binding response OmpR family regulator